MKVNKMVIRDKEKLIDSLETQLLQTLGVIHSKDWNPFHDIHWEYFTDAWRMNDGYDRKSFELMLRKLQLLK